jgi:hypothetical protein
MGVAHIHSALLGEQDREDENEGESRNSQSHIRNIYSFLCRIARKKVKKSESRTGLLLSIYCAPGENERPGAPVPKAFCRAWQAQWRSLMRVQFGGRVENPSRPTVIS